jgi:outer membrane biosynthesis protein TonB
VEATATLPYAGFGSHARSALKSTDDIRVLLGALETVGGAGGSLAASSAIPAGYSDFCNGLLAHAKTLYADATASCDGTPNSSTGRVEPGRITKRTAPEYPVAAKAVHMEGKAVFTGLIGKDGKIKSLELLSSPLAFYESARSAVSKWEYQPYLLNGDPVEVVTKLTVNYTLQ